MDKKFYAAKDICKIFNIPKYKLEYLFTSNRLKRDEFTTLSGQRIYTVEDIDKIKKALDDVAMYS